MVRWPAVDEIRIGVVMTMTDMIFVTEPCTDSRIH